VLGRRRAFLLGLAAFTLASLIGGLSPTPAALIVARALQGASGALMTPQVLSIIQLQYTGEARARAIGAYSMILAVGVAGGQVLGGFLVGAHLLAAAWRPALLLNAPVGALLLFAARRGLPTMAPGPPRRLDLVGSVVLSAALLTLVLPLTFLIMTASLVGQVLGVAGFVGIYLDAAPHGAAHALALTTGALAAALIAATVCAYTAFARRPSRPRSVVHGGATG
jgi:MFS family permease